MEYLVPRLMKLYAVYHFNYQGYKASFIGKSKYLNLRSRPKERVNSDKDSSI